MNLYADSKYKLLLLIADEVAPDYQCDEDGYFQQPSQAPNIFLRRKDDNKIKPPFTYEDYINDKDIIHTLKGYEIDIEQFWLALLFVYDFTQANCINVLSLGETAKIQMEKLKEFLSGIDSFTVTADGKKKLEINELYLINHLRNHLEILLDEKSENLKFSSFHFTSIEMSKDLYSPSVQMWFSATRFIRLFEALELPNKRAKDVVKYGKENCEGIILKNSIQTVSFNKMLLISQLMYFMRFTDNKSFLISENSLKGILKQYKNFKINTVNKVYFGC